MSLSLAALIMPSKRRLAQSKSARAAAVLSWKRRKVQASLVLNSAQLDIYVCGAFVWHKHYFEISSTSLG